VFGGRVCGVVVASKQGFAALLHAKAAATVLKPFNTTSVWLPTLSFLKDHAWGARGCRSSGLGCKKTSALPAGGTEQLLSPWMAASFLNA